MTADPEAPLRDHLDALWTDPDERAWSAQVLGSDDPAQVAGALWSTCARHLPGASHIARVLFVYQSVSVTVGLELGSGEHVVVKARDPGPERWAHITSSSAAQHTLAERGFPCPEVLAGPVPCLGGRAVSIERFAAPGAFGDTREPPLRRAMAQGLWDVWRALADIAPWPSLPRWGRPPSGLWRAPHSPYFAGFAEAPGGAWIDACAARALDALDATPSPAQVGHGDWSPQNMRFDGERVGVVYDWDSLIHITEPAHVAAAAVHATCNHVTDLVFAPTPESVDGFVADYLDARGAPFDDDGWLHLCAAMVYSAAYTARLQHFIAPDASLGERDFRPALRWMDARLVQRLQARGG